MRYFRFPAFVITSIIFGACGKGEQQHQTADSAVTTPPVPPPPAAPAPVVSPPAMTSSSVPQMSSTPHTKSSAGITHGVVQSIGALKYVDIVQGQGDVAQSGIHVMVLYTGRLANGTTFDSTIDRNHPFEFQLGSGQVIQGWDVGIKGMRVGGKRRLIIPPELGYGEGGSGPIPPNSTLTFDVELLGVKP
jgi:peptidylprolyl isomerase